MASLKKYVHMAVDAETWQAIKTLSTLLNTSLLNTVRKLVAVGGKKLFEENAQLKEKEIQALRESFDKFGV